ncbi:Acg family FMN-binding oxidoreductase [Pseudonocardia abyssalis]|uniref:Nitroreductase n=1 Tax=Pseudonocardia abyssalis TaxID=2792008 RepID=A0ABS6UNS9_9PSEU|nr:nitroreductase [Pseudonocardia abyssalis]MBW0117795.1 nitroreductase [Pseudonocardia abyssalis]MBW0133899.1 nitroreductase [Pseudonocardia abyssalis]
MTDLASTLGLTGEQVEHVLATAGRAPSLHNAQPWRFRLRPDVVELHADPERRLPVVDPDDREQRIACGAALFTLCLALRGHDIRPIVTLFPDPSRPDLVAAVRHGGDRPATPDERRLLRAVPLRRTNRHPFAGTAVTRQELHAMRRAALDEGAWLQFVDDPAQRAGIQRLALLAHREQLADPAFTAELRSWTGTGPDRRDGVPAGAGGPRPAPQDRWVLRDFGAGTAPDRVPGKDFEHDPLIAVLTSHLTGRRAEVQTGRALQRLLLAATADGLAASFLSQIVEVPGPRDQLRRLIGATRPPQVVLRIGRGWPVSATPRLAVADLIMGEPSHRS